MPQWRVNQGPHSSKSARVISLVTPELWNVEVFEVVPNPKPKERKLKRIRVQMDPSWLEKVEHPFTKPELIEDLRMPYGHQAKEPEPN